MKNIDGKEFNTAKGVKIVTEFNEFKDTLFKKKIMRHKMRKIQAKKHKLGTYKIDKISLSFFDDKIFVLNDEIYTLAFFHKDIDSHKKQQQQQKRVLMKKKRFSQIKRIQKDFHKKKRFTWIKKIQKESS